MIFICCVLCGLFLLPAALPCCALCCLLCPLLFSVLCSLLFRRSVAFTSHPLCIKLVHICSCSREKRHIPHHNMSTTIDRGLTENSVLRMEQSYQAILGTEPMPQVIEVRKARRIVCFSAISFLIFLFGITFLYSGSTMNPYMKATNPSEMFLSGKCAPCTFMECKSDLCDAKLDPYQCTNGAALNGCSVEEDTWSKSGVCNECCSAIDCAATVLRGNNDDTVVPCVDCTKAQCSTLALVSSQTCYKEAPYVCVKGSSRMGCSSDPYHWAAMTETQCR